MSAGTLKINCEQGATFNLIVAYKNPDKTPIDLTDYTARMVVKSHKDSPADLVTLTTENGRIEIQGELGKIDLSINATDTAAFAQGYYVYDLLITDSYGAFSRIIEGYFVVDGSVS